MCLPGHEVADGQHRESGRARRIGRGSNNFSAQDHGDPGFVGHLSRLVARFVAQAPHMATANQLDVISSFMESSTPGQGLLRNNDTISASIERHRTSNCFLTGGPHEP